MPSYRTNAAQNRRTDEESDQPEYLVWITRGCRQKSLLQTITARSWQMAKYDAVLLA